MDRKTGDLGENLGRGRGVGQVGRVEEHPESVLGCGLGTVPPSLQAAQAEVMCMWPVSVWPLCFAFQRP